MSCLNPSANVPEFSVTAAAVFAIFLRIPQIGSATFALAKQWFSPLFKKETLENIE